MKHRAVTGAMASPAQQAPSHGHAENVERHLICCGYHTGGERERVGARRAELPSCPKCSISLTLPAFWVIHQGFSVFAHGLGAGPRGGEGGG